MFTIINDIVGIFVIMIIALINVKESHTFIILQKTIDVSKILIIFQDLGKEISQSTTTKLSEEHDLGNHTLHLELHDLLIDIANGSTRRGMMIDPYKINNLIIAEIRLFGLQRLGTLDDLILSLISKRQIKEIQTDSIIKAHMIHEDISILFRKESNICSRILLKQILGKHCSSNMPIRIVMVIDYMCHFDSSSLLKVANSSLALSISSHSLA